MGLRKNKKSKQLKKITYCCIIKLWVQEEQLMTWNWDKRSSKVTVDCPQEWIKVSIWIEDTPTIYFKNSKINSSKQMKVSSKTKVKPKNKKEEL